MNRDRLVGHLPVADQFPPGANKSRRLSAPADRVEGDAHRAAGGCPVDFLGPAPVLCRHDRDLREALAQFGGASGAADDVDEAEVVEFARAGHQSTDRRARGGLQQDIVVSDGLVLLRLSAQHHRGERIHEHLRGDLVRQLLRYGDDHVGVRHDPLGPRAWLREDRYTSADLDTWSHTRMWPYCLHHARGLDTGWNRLCIFPRVGLDGLQITGVHQECRWYG
ncbi:hypothetical protein ACWC2T_34710 [Streptomyces sp. NPDC001393]